MGYRYHIAHIVQRKKIETKAHTKPQNKKKKGPIAVTRALVLSWDLYGIYVLATRSGHLSTSNRGYRLSTQDTRHKAQRKKALKRRLRRFEKDAPRAALRFAASLLVLCLFILYLFLCRTRALNIGGGIDGTDHSQISDSPQLDLLVILRVGDRHLDILIPQRPRR